MANIKRNLMYSTVLTMSTYLVPLIVFPYISRVLGVDGIGIVDTVDNMIDYCILFSMMGLSSVGVREIAKNKDNPQALSQTFTDLFALNLCSTLLIATVFCGVVLMSPRLQDYGLLIPIGILKLTANLFWIEWLYTGLEDFRYITLRSIILRTAFIIAVFLFVQTRADVVTYYALFVGITVGNAVCNWCHKRTYLHWDIRRANIRRFLVPFFMLGIFAMLSAVYSKLSLPVLNFLTDNELIAKTYVQNITMFFYIFAIAIGQAAQILTGHLVGAGKTDEAYRRVLKAHRTALLIALGICLVGVLLRYPLLGIFTQNPEVIELGATVLLINIALEFGRTTNLVLIACLRGAGDVYFPTACAIFSMWLISVLGSYVFAVVLGMGLYGLWIALAADEVVRGVLMIIRWNSGKWKNKSPIKRSDNT